jgi:hypothetical protein
MQEAEKMTANVQYMCSGLKVTQVHYLYRLLNKPLSLTTDHTIDYTGLCRPHNALVLAEPFSAVSDHCPISSILPLTLAS